MKIVLDEPVDGSHVAWSGMSVELTVIIDQSLPAGHRRTDSGRHRLRGRDCLWARAAKASNAVRSRSATMASDPINRSWQPRFDPLLISASR